MSYPVDPEHRGGKALQAVIEEELLARVGDSVPRDVLGQYIVVMLAHGNNTAQVTENLVAFLGQDQAADFAGWLFAHMEESHHLYTSEALAGLTQGEAAMGEDEPPSAPRRLRSLVKADVSDPAEDERELPPDPWEKHDRPHSRRGRDRYDVALRTTAQPWFDHDNRDGAAPSRGRGRGSNRGYDNRGPMEYDRHRRGRRVEYMDDDNRGNSRGGGWRGGRSRSRSRSPVGRFWLQNRGEDRAGPARLLSRANEEQLRGPGNSQRILRGPTSSSTVFERLSKVGSGGAQGDRPSVFDRLSSEKALFSERPAPGILSRLQAGGAVVVGDDGVGEENMDAMKFKIRKMQLEMMRIMAKQKEMVISMKGVSHTASKAEEDNRSVVVQNVHFAATEQVVAAHFMTCGQILRVTIPKNKISGQAKGYAFVQFAIPDSVPRAMALSGSTMLGRAMQVIQKETRIPSTKPPAGGDGGAAGRGGLGRGRGRGRSVGPVAVRGRGRGRGRSMVYVRKTDVSTGATPAAAEGASEMET